MKKTLILSTTLAALSFAVAPAVAEDSAVSETVSAEAAAENTTTVYIVKFKGKG